VWSCTSYRGCRATQRTPPCEYIEPVTGERFPLDTPRWCGPRNAPLLLTPLPGITRSQIKRSCRSLWRYAAAFPLAVDEPISLGEGCTPLVRRAPLASSLGGAAWLRVSQGWCAAGSAPVRRRWCDCALQMRVVQSHLQVRPVAQWRWAVEICPLVLLTRGVSALQPGPRSTHHRTRRRTLACCAEAERRQHDNLTGGARPGMRAPLPPFCARLAVQLQGQGHLRDAVVPEAAGQPRPSCWGCRLPGQCVRERERGPLISQ
jgi:hypothetical protein